MPCCRKFAVARASVAPQPQSVAECEYLTLLTLETDEKGPRVANKLELSIMLQVVACPFCRSCD